MFGTNFGIELKMFFFLNIPEICFHTQMFCMDFGIELKMFVFYKNPRNVFKSPKCVA